MEINYCNIDQGIFFCLFFYQFFSVCPVKDFPHVPSFGAIPLASENVVPSPKATVAIASCLFIGVWRQGATLPNDSLSSANVNTVSQDCNSISLHVCVNVNLCMSVN